MKVLMVCLGNICRSPVAEEILRHKANERGFEIGTDSAGTASYHLGSSPDIRMTIAARNNGYDISDLRARQFSVSDFEKFDYIFAMDQSNYRNILDLATSEDERNKVLLMLNESKPDSNAEVPDPYYGGDQGFQDVIDLLDVAIDSFLERVNA